MLQEALMSEQKLPAGVGDIEQAGAICIRRMRTSRPEVLLVSSRRNGRWGLPKGHIEPNENSKTTAEREAFEEAGVLGSADAEPFGSFHYFKDRTARHYKVTVHLLELRSIANSFPEQAIRKTKWFSLAEAAREASQPGLKELLIRLGRRFT